DGGFREATDHRRAGVEVRVPDAEARRLRHEVDRGETRDDLKGTAGVHGRLGRGDCGGGGRSERGGVAPATSRRVRGLLARAGKLPAHPPPGWRRYKAKARTATTFPSATRRSCSSRFLPFRLAREIAGTPASRRCFGTGST